ncbi:MAG: Glycosyltransferase [Ignavibacteria bacterium]|nr:MAG: Glycosyltransferase [Ignavibacteria bacterium]KAF0162427.1 MAG: Glycosyltransferase [Ignavibacteria bacterium]
MNSGKSKISVVIIAFNEEANLGECLESVKWAEEIIVVDSFSYDKTIEVAKQFTDKVFQKKWEGFARQRKFSLETASNEWVLSLDADERVTPELKNSILKVIEKDSQTNGYKAARRNYFLGKWITGAHWYPDYQLRFFKKDKARIEEVLVHEGFEVEGKTEIIAGDIIHFSYRSLDDAYRKINHYSSLAAQQKADKKVNAADIILHPIAAFLTDYFSRKAYKDGLHGLLVAIMHAMTNLMTYTKIWELQNINKKLEK